MSEAEDLERAMREAMSQPITITPYPMGIQFQQAPTYRVTVIGHYRQAGVPVYVQSDVTGWLSFEDGHALFKFEGRIIRAYSREIWTNIEILEDE